MIGATVKAALTNFNATYFLGPLPLIVFTIVALLAVAGDASRANLLMSIDFAATAWLGVLAGTTLAEIKVKPLSFVLPGQERAMAPAMLRVGLSACLVGALPVLIRPMSVVEVPALQQALAALGFGLGLFMLVVTVCVATRDTAYTQLIAVLPTLLLLVAMIHASFRQPIIALNAALAEHSIVSVPFAVLGIGALFYVLGRRSLSRRLCGAPFLPLKAYDNPFKMDDFRNRMHGASFRPSIMTASRGGPGGLVLAALSRRLAGTSWDYLVLDTRVSRNEWQFASKLFYFAVMIAFMTWIFRTSVAGGGPPGKASMSLVILLVLTFFMFAPTFKPRLSPMLSVTRRQHFKSFVSKAVSVYGSTILAMLALRSAVGLLGGSTGLLFSTFAEVAALPFKGVLVVAAVTPLLCWAFAALRSTAGLLVVVMLLTGIAVSVAGRAEAALLGLSYATVLVVSAVCWLPFLGIARKRCFKDDLLLP